MDDHVENPSPTHFAEQDLNFFLMFIFIQGLKSATTVALWRWDVALLPKAPPQMFWQHPPFIGRWEPHVN
jgi:hypothetical protein